MADNERNHAADIPQARTLPPEIEKEILRAIAKIDYGSIEVVVHDGRVVQIECREKIRVVRDDSGRNGAIRQIR
ncbi:MAG TPA: YezD family protein [Burkholderiales bacterium]|nr:YezD family protein [Burkholderiales bacterium]